MSDLEGTEEEFELDIESGYDEELEGEFDEEFEGEFDEELDIGYEAELEYDEEIPDDAELESPFSEEEEMELAAELLSITNEAELDLFLGKIFKKVKKFVKGPVGRALGRVLKKVAKVALPIAGRALGTFVGGPVGGAIGGKLASTAGKIFGLELEGLSPEDQEFELAKRFVRLAGVSANNVGLIWPATTPEKAAKAAVIAAAKKHAPGLVKKVAGITAAGTIGTRASGKWIRRGNAIMVLGV